MFADGCINLTIASIARETLEKLLAIRLTAWITRERMQLNRHPSSGIDWMAVVPYRVDLSGTQKVYDQDPYIVTFDADSGEPAATGIVVYHQNYPGRTSPISGYDHLSKPDTVARLRQELITGKYPASKAPSSVLNALHHAAKLFMKNIG